MPRKPRIVTGMQAYGEGALLRELRINSGISLTEMAKNLTYHKSFLSAIETGTEKASSGVIDGYEKELKLKPGELRDRIAALRSNSPKRAIELLTNNWLLWLDILHRILPNRGKDGADSEEGADEYRQNAEKYRRSLELALQNAAECFLVQSQSLEEMEHRLKVLAVLSNPGESSKALRIEGFSDFFPSIVSITSQGFSLLEGEEKRYLHDFFAALLSELSFDPLFELPMSSELQEHLSSNTRRTPTETVEMLHRLYEMLELRYTPDHLERQMLAYSTYMEKAFQDVDLISFAPSSQYDRAALSAIFVPPSITKLESYSHMPQQSQTEPPLTILQFLADFHSVVLLGDPGMGKSTITRYLAWSHAAAQRADEQLHTMHRLLGDPLPLHIELRLFMEYWSLQHHELQQVSADDFLTYAAMVCSSAHDDMRISVALFRHLLERRCMILLFDGLDEVTGLRERQALVTAIEDFASCYPGNAILVTSRLVGYALARFSEHVFTHAEILAFDDKQIKQLVEDLYQYLVQKHVLSEQDESDIDMILKRLSEPGLRRLAVNPLLLTVMSIQSRARGIADRRGDIYEACARLLLSKWASLKGTDERWKDVQLSQEDQYACIAHLGLVLHEHMQEQAGTADVPAEFLQTEVERFLSNQNSLAGGTREDLHSQATLFLDMMKEETGLIIQRGTGEGDLPLYGFIHRTFQEYFAAVAVYNRYWQERAEEPHQLDDFIIKHLHSAHWREVILLLLAKLPPESATARLQTILDSKSSFNSILKQDLFFVCDCLLDEIMAEDALAQRVIAELRDVIKSSPFYTQQREAITYLVSLLQTRDYARLAGGALIACLIEDSPLRVRLQVAQNLYMHASQDSQECQQAFHTLMLAAQQYDRYPSDAADIILFLYQYSAEDSEYWQRALDLFLSYAERPQLTAEQLWEFADFLIRRLHTDTSERWQHDAQRILQQLINRSDLTAPQRVELIKRICNSSFNIPWLWSLTYQMVADLERSAQVTISDVAQITQILYRCTHNFSRPEQSEEHLLARQKLQVLFASPELPIEEKLQIAETFLQSDEAELRHDAIQLCMRLIRGRELPPPATQLLLTLITRLYEHHRRAQERRQAFQMLAKLVHWRTINVAEILNFVWTLYRFGENGDDQRTHAVQLLSDIAERKDAPIEQLLQIADIIHSANFPRSEQSAQPLLINLLERNKMLSTPQLLHIARLLVSGVESDTGWQHFKQVLSLLLQRTDMTAEYLTQLTLNHRSDASALRHRILQHFADLAEDQTLLIDKCLLIVTPLLKSYDVSYVYKAKAVQAVITLLQPEPAKKFLEQYWRSPLREIIADMPFMAELAQQVLLPDQYRDGIYVKLRQMIAQSSDIVAAGHARIIL
jgi:transcriptional regulator with XRE-family HTH domain